MTSSNAPPPRLLEEVSRLLQRIESARREISDLRPNELQQVHLPTAEDELDAIVVATEAATQTILDAAERISETARTQGEPGAKINDQVMRIFEACTFQDITGQRVTKVIRTLKDIEALAAGLVRVVAKLQDQSGGAATGGAGAAAPPPPPRPAAKPAKPGAELLNGPQLPGRANSQADIDALFNSAPGGKAS